MFVNKDGYAEVFDIVPEIMEAQRRKGLQIERSIGVLSLPFQRCTATNRCVATGGSYAEAHPDITAAEMADFVKDAKLAYETRRRAILEAANIPTAP